MFVGMSRGVLVLVVVASFGLSIDVGCAPVGADEELTGKENGRGKDQGATDDESSTDDDGAKAPTVTGLPCDVAQVLKSRCQGCHGPSPKYGASDSLVTYDDLQATISGKKFYELVQARIHDDRRPMPPPPNERLTAAESKILDDWIAAGAKRSDETCGSATGGDDGKGSLDVKPLDCKADLVVRSASKFVMPKASDLYVCVGVDVPVEGRRHITAMAPHIDNGKILHHVLLMQSSEPVSKTPYVCGGFGSQSWKLVAGWAPGADNFVLPPEAGFPYDAKTNWVLQLHYNNAKGLEGEADNSGFDVCTTDQLRANDAGVMAFGSMNFKIPPRSKTTVTCNFVLPPLVTSGVKLIRSWPHMHDLGAAMKTTHTVVGKTNVVVDAPNFSFQDQVSYPANEDVKPGETVTTSCTWNNTRDTQVTWGEGTDQEMCYNFTTYYPAMGGEGSTSFPWMTPSLAATCQTTSE